MLSEAKSASGGKLTILGSGVAYLTPERSCPAYLVEEGNTKVLLDCGAGAMTQLAKIKVKVTDLDAVFITHQHADHLGELLSLILAIYVANIYYKAEEKKLTIVGPEKFKENYNKLFEVLFPEKNPNFQIEILELVNGSSVKVGHLKVESAQVPHSQIFKANAYKVSHNNRSIVYTGDIDNRPNEWGDLVKMAQKCNYLMVDTCRPIVWEQGYHLQPKQVGELASKIEAKNLILTHLTDLNKEGELMAEAKKSFSGNVIVAKDLMEINI